MAKHNITLAVLILLALAFFIITMVFTALAGQGQYPFLSSTGNISDVFSTQITPAGWAFAIWGIIYSFLACSLVFLLSGLVRKNAYGYIYCSPAVLPHAFFITLCLNLGFNVGWLFLWDRRYMVPAVVFLFLIASTNYTMIFLSCYGLKAYGPWLNKYHKVDLWLYRVLIQNGIAIYATWTTIASLLNLTIVLTSNGSLSQTDAATLSLSLLTVMVVVWFILENSYLDKHVRFILSINPVLIWSLTGVFTNNYNAAAPTRNDVFTAVLLAVACVMCATRVVLVIWRQRLHPLFNDVDPEDMAPMEFAERQKTFFK